MKKAPGHAEVDSPEEVLVEVEEEVLAAARDVFDAAAGKPAAELLRRHQLDEARGVLRHPGLGDGAADDKRQQIAADRLDFGQFGHGDRIREA